MYKKIFAIILFLIIAGLGIFYQKISLSADVYGDDRKFVIQTGEGINQISRDLYNQGLIKSKLAFETYVWLFGWEGKFKAGEHTLNPRLNIREISQVLIKGNTVSRETQIKIIEGWNINDIKTYLNSQGLPGTALASTAETKIPASSNPNLTGLAEEYDFLKDLPPAATLEGFLFPDTYKIFKESTSLEIMNKMLSNFDKKFTPEMRSEIKRQNKSIYEIVTVASLIEKEVRTPADMKIVSGILWDRLKNGQALQLDSTLSYILGDTDDQHSVEETKTDSPYNTYRHKGLPPGPICNPGLNAITAAIYPIQTAYNYFLTAKVNGENKVIYSKSFDEHVRNKNLYLR